MYERYESFEKMWNLYKADCRRGKNRPMVILSHKTVYVFTEPLVTNFTPENKERIRDHQATP